MTVYLDSYTNNPYFLLKAGEKLIGDWVVDNKTKEIRLIENEKKETFCKVVGKISVFISRRIGKISVTGGVPSSTVTMYFPLRNGEKLIRCWTFGGNDGEIGLVQNQEKEQFFRICNNTTAVMTLNHTRNDSFQNRELSNIFTDIALTKHTLLEIFFRIDVQTFRGWRTKSSENTDTCLLVLPYSPFYWFTYNTTDKKRELFEADPSITAENVSQLLDEYSLKIEHHAKRNPSYSAEFLPYVHTWSLGNEYEIRLVRRSNQLFRELIPAKTQTLIAPLITPEPLTTTEFINELKELHPIVIQESPLRVEFTDCLHTWDLMNGSRVKLLRGENYMKYETISEKGKLQITTVDLPEGTDIDAYAEQLTNQHPILVPGDPISVRFVRHVSKLDDQKEISKEITAITVVNGISKLGCNPDPSTWYGHASICTEVLWSDQRFNRQEFLDSIIKKITYLEERLKLFEESGLGQVSTMEYRKLLKNSYEDRDRITSLRDLDPVTIKGHLTNEGVRLELLLDFDLSTISGKTETWTRPIAITSKMLEEMKTSMDKAEFCITGDRSWWANAQQIFQEDKRNLTRIINYLSFDQSTNNPGLENEKEPSTPNARAYHNCITWSGEILGVAEIRLPKTSTSFFPIPLLVTPGDYIPIIPRKITNKDRSSCNKVETHGKCK